MKALRAIAGLIAAAAAAFLAPAPASADLRLSELIVDLQPGKQTRDDIEIWNDSPDRAFVAVEPREIVNPALANQSIFRDPDPEKLGLLVSPSRLILESGQRKLIRVATVVAPGTRERTYRITVKPVVGGVQADNSGLKILVGYDVLVLVRPRQSNPDVSGVRSGRSLHFDNRGNVSVELIDGRQCGSSRTVCTPLPAKRLYPGASWTVSLPTDAPAEYTLKSPARADHKVY